MSTVFVPGPAPDAGPCVVCGGDPDLVLADGIGEEPPVAFCAEHQTATTADRLHVGDDIQVFHYTGPCPLPPDALPPLELDLEGRYEVLSTSDGRVRLRHDSGAERVLDGNAILPSPGVLHHRFIDFPRGNTVRIQKVADCWTHEVPVDEWLPHQGPLRCGEWLGVGTLHPDACAKPAAAVVVIQTSSTIDVVVLCDACLVHRRNVAHVYGRWSADTQRWVLS